MPTLELECPTCFHVAARLPHSRNDARSLQQSFYGKELKLHRSPRAGLHGQHDDRRADNGQLLQRIYRCISRIFSASGSGIGESHHYNAWKAPLPSETDDPKAKLVQSQLRNSYENDLEHGNLCGSEDCNQAPDSGKIITVNHFWLWMIKMKESDASMFERSCCCIPLVLTMCRDNNHCHT